ncbi:PASTA domain-containing protein [Micromonospora sp. M71_S20]|nr:PASTA domain-containing protein [Micromonospora sp. M71_S20]
MKMPNLIGENAQIAYETLTDLGFTKITFGSQDTDDKIVLYPPNWTVTKQSTKAGVKVRVDRTIVLTCTKEG